MPSVIAVGSGPIAFTTKDGQALLIPLTAISFENGTAKLSAAYSAYQAELQPWLNCFTEQRAIQRVRFVLIPCLSLVRLPQ